MLLSVNLALARRGFQLAAAFGVDLAKHPVVVLFGPSGCGKSTVLRALAGLEPEASGRVTLGGVCWRDERFHLPAQQRRVGMVFQDLALFPHLSARDNVMFGMDRKRPLAQRAADAQDWLRRLGVAECAQQRPPQLSGGQQQRVALARALASQPALLLLDEPLSALDARARDDVRVELGRHLRDAGVPALLVTHDRADALALGDAMVVMDGGRVLQSGPVRTVMGTPASAEVARVVGTETVLEGTVGPLGGDVRSVQVGSATLWSASSADPGAVMVCIRAEDVTLEPASDTSATSARNRLPARVVALEDLGTLVRVMVDAGFPLHCALTRRSVEELGLAVGRPVQAVVKATAVHLVPRAQPTR
jgi:molybdate transport system ATP-binding protein